MNILKVLTEKRRLGNIGEAAAAKFLKKSGYKILERNYTAFDSEIDIIAKNRDHIIFVEVKTRTLGHSNAGEGRPASALTPEKQRKLISVAKCYIAMKRPAGRIRFDVIEVYADENKKVQKIMHLESAFNYNTAHSARSMR